MATLGALRTSGAFRAVRDSRWRRNRLLILCYHGVALDDEHLWRPRLYVPPHLLEQRFEILKRGGYSVLGLGEALQKLPAGKLPPRSVVLTFDDGGYDFYKLAHPLLKKYGFPATVYQTTYYSDYQAPIFNLVCSYILWQRRGSLLDKGREMGLAQPMDLRTELSRHRIVRVFVERAEAENLTGRQKNEIAKQLAKLLDVDYDAICARRLLHIMSPQEVTQIIAEGVDVQLHTHRHRTPENERLFRREIEDNRKSLPDGGKLAQHFCYPSGVYREQFIPWLQAENVLSATTCDVALATRKSNPWLLPRFIDTAKRTDVEFESWVTGVGDLLAFRRAATQQYIPDRD
ncbi:MAG TPA: polysaccharide deacetylase family protein [Terriglobales bacterium]|nr:polysaccharide deacetylase family protein [Terriglobales bacterium]